MIGKNLILSLKTDINGTSQLCYDLGLKIKSEDIYQIEIELPTGIVTLKKSVYFNYHTTKKFKIFDNGTVFFILCNKQVNPKFAFNELIRHAISKIEKRKAFLNDYKTKLESEIKPLHQRKATLVA